MTFHGNIHTVFWQKRSRQGELHVCPDPDEQRRDGGHDAHRGNVQRPSGVPRVLEVGDDARRGGERPYRARVVAHCVLDRST